MGGRLAVKLALMARCYRDGFCRPLPGDLTILPDAQGRPQLTGNLPLSPIHLSISHSRNYGAALVSREGACGVDIEQIHSRILRIGHRFCDRRERKILTSLPGSTDWMSRLTLLWSAKEAVKKQISGIQPGLFSGIRLLTAEPTAGHRCWLLQCSVPGETEALARVQIRIRGRYCLAHTNGAPHA